jgi:hypothetical protein
VHNTVDVSTDWLDQVPHPHNQHRHTSTMAAVFVRTQEEAEALLPPGLYKGKGMAMGGKVPVPTTIELVLRGDKSFTYTSTPEPNGVFRLVESSGTFAIFPEKIELSVAKPTRGREENSKIELFLSDKSGKLKAPVGRSRWSSFITLKLVQKSEVPMTKAARKT